MLDLNRKKWKAIEPQVKLWVLRNFSRWMLEKPEWFTETWKSRLPLDWVPQEGKSAIRKSHSKLAVEGSDLRRRSVKALALVVGQRPDEEGGVLGDGGGGGGKEAGTREGARVQPVM